jgi:hypothetical protein
MSGECDQCGEHPVDGCDCFDLCYFCQGSGCKHCKEDSSQENPISDIFDGSMKHTWCRTVHSTVPKYIRDEQGKIISRKMVCKEGCDGK